MSSTEGYRAHGSGHGASQIAASIETAVREGELRPGQELLPIRDLATELGVSPSTVAGAYRALRERGLVTTRGRGGTRISLGPALPIRGALHVPAGVRNLADGNPDPALLPDLGPALAQVPSQPRMYGEEPCLPALLELAGQQFEADDVPTTALTVVSGAMEAFERILGAHLKRGDRVGIEDPGHASLIDLTRSLGFSIEPMAVDAYGPTPDEVEKALRRGVRAVALTPRAHNPTGAVMSAQRLDELGEVLRNFPDVLVIEDDHSAWTSGAPSRTLANQDLGHWAVIRSVSKSLGPDLRLAVVAGDTTTIGRVEGRRLLGSGWVSSLLQHLVVLLWSDPKVDQVVAEAAQTYAQRRVGLIDALRERGIASQGDSGINVWVPVADELGPARRLIDLGWAVSVGQRFRLLSPPALRVTTSTLLPDEAARFVDDLASALRPDHRTRQA